MARRMTDTEIWKKDWFLDLSIKQKCLIKFLYDNCDCAGVYEISYRTLRNCFNEEIVKEDFDGLKQISFIADNKIFIEDFIKFQYGISINELNPQKSNVHKGIYKSLEKNGLLTLEQPLTKGSLRVLDKDKDKNKDIDKDIDKDKEIDKDNIKKIDRYSNNYITLYQKYYKRIIGCKNCFLLQMQRDKITEIAEELGENFEDSLKLVFKQLKEIKWDSIGIKPTSSWLLKDDNYMKVYEGMYMTEKQSNSPYSYIGG